ncbi:MAG TPA: FHA domain-containing protein [Tepidisphaeraceae bacterium]|jgi:pSer/pThr/pTyr-binding forkhead associated (FHA) protein|nr:FHA domain-containing protein [Tepidisphaeraceae bacterium]
MGSSASSTEEAASPTLVAEVPAAGVVVSVNRQLTVVGRGPHARLRLRSDAVSRCHAAVIRNKGGVYVRDLSRQGNVQVNGQPVLEVELHNGDQLGFGPFAFRVRGLCEVETQDEFIPMAWLIAGADQTAIEGRTLLIGRTESCDLRVDDTRVSRAHALIFLLEGRHYIRDLYSRTGTRVNGTAAKQEALAEGDIIEIGQVEFCYRRGARDNGASIEKNSSAGDASARGRTPVDPEVWAGEGILCNRPMDLSQLQPIDAKQSVDATAISEETTDSGDVVETGLSALRGDRPFSDSLQAALAESAAKDTAPGPSWSAPGCGTFVIGLQWGEYVGQPSGKCDSSEPYELPPPGPE